jgi:dinuclear metal center YbgI/SA1388 family protein
MTRDRTTRVHDLLGLLNGLYPPALAEDWDNVGLQVGDPTAEVTRVMVCLDADTAAIEKAAAAGAQALVAHHPLLFKGLKKISPLDEPGSSVYAAIRTGVSVLCAHTNLDRARNGLNDWLAARVGLTAAEPLLGGREGELLKLVVFVPEGHQEKVTDALFAAGAGHVGGYDCCSFRVSGQGSFRPGETSDPYIGSCGELERTEEWRIEMVVPRELSGRIVNRLLKVHPYEEVAYDLLPLQNRRTDLGLGRIGKLSAPLTLGDCAARVKVELELDHLRVVGSLEKQVSKVAVCGGSGAFLLHDAARQGADVLITGDVKYHEARNAEQLGIGLIDAGHFGTERIAIDGLVAALTGAAEKKQQALEFITLEGEREPFQVV